MNSYEQSYIGQLRAMVGDRMLITPGVRAMMLDDNNQILLIKRRDNGLWAAPAGGLELGESVYDCLVREVREETGLTVLGATLIAIYSDPRFSHTNMFGNQLQPLMLEFHVHQWTGTPVKQTDETTDIGFFDANGLPPLMDPYPEVIDDFLAYEGGVIVK